jgi:GT2 family glycosyltransferase
MVSEVETPVVIVTFGNPAEVIACVSAVSKQRGVAKVGVFLCENGGPRAFDALLAALTKANGPATGMVETPASAEHDIFERVIRLRLTDSQAPLYVAQAPENLGFAGGVNAWMRPLMKDPGTKGVWVLNPDTLPEPDALAALIAYAEARRKGMVQSRVMFPGRTDVNASRGLRYRKLLARGEGVGYGAPVSPAPNPDDVEKEMEAPTGVSLYVTRTCVEQVGLMDESYFLYWEDFDWGVRARAKCGIGYAHDSVVSHVGGTTTGRAKTRARRSPTSVYLQNRGALQFVRRHHPRWFAWTVFASYVNALEYLAVGSFANFKAATDGLAAGLRGETGRPRFAPSLAKPGEDR